MSIHKLLYWPHLICGVIAGILILIMSVTGVLLTYERQIIAWAETNFETPLHSSKTPLIIDDVINMNRKIIGDNKLRSIKIYNNPDTPLVIRAKEYLYFNRYTGDFLGNGPIEVKTFLISLRGLHRWLSMEGENRTTARMFTGAANLMFLFIVISGIYLWLPKVLNWSNIKKILFLKKTRTSKARDFNWHNVMGIWSAIPLIIIISTATVFNYTWANKLVYNLAGEEPPVRGRPTSNSDLPTNIVTQTITFDAMFNAAKEVKNNWRSITMTYPKATDKEVKFSVDSGNGGEPQKKGDLFFNRISGQLEKWVPFSDFTAGKRARYYIRYLHTGEALGIIGQTIAGIVALFSTVLVWTGLALAYRKYLKPLRRKSRRQVSSTISE